MEQGRFLEIRIEPSLFVLALENDRHAVVNGRHKRVGRRRDNRLGLNVFIRLGIVPAGPQARKGEERVVFETDVEGLFA